MDWYLKVLKNYIGFGMCAAQRVLMFILVNLILTGVLSIIDKMLGWQRAGGEGILTTIYGVLVFFYRGGRCNFAVCMTPIVRHGGYCCC